MFTHLCIAYSVGSSCILILAGMFLYPNQHVLQSFVEMETINNFGPSLAGNVEGGGEDLDIESSSLSVMRSQDFVTSYMSSYNMYHEAIHK